MAIKTIIDPESLGLPESDSYGENCIITEKGIQPLPQTYEPTPGEYPWKVLDVAGGRYYGSFVNKSTTYHMFQNMLIDDKGRLTPFTIYRSSNNLDGFEVASYQQGGQGVNLGLILFTSDTLKTVSYINVVNQQLNIGYGGKKLDLRVDENNVCIFDNGVLAFSDSAKDPSLIFCKDYDIMGNTLTGVGDIATGQNDLTASRLGVKRYQYFLPAAINPFSFDNPDWSVGSATETPVIPIQYDLKELSTSLGGILLDQKVDVNKQDIYIYNDLWWAAINILDVPNVPYKGLVKIPGSLFNQGRFITSGAIAHTYTSGDGSGNEWQEFVKVNELVPPWNGISQNNKFVGVSRMNPFAAEACLSNAGNSFSTQNDAENWFFSSNNTALHRFDTEPSPPWPDDDNSPDDESAQAEILFYNKSRSFNMMQRAQSEEHHDKWIMIGDVALVYDMSTNAVLFGINKWDEFNIASATSEIYPWKQFADYQHIMQNRPVKTSFGWMFDNQNLSGYGYINFNNILTSHFEVLTPSSNNLKIDGVDVTAMTANQYQTRGGKPSVVNVGNSINLGKYIIVTATADAAQQNVLDGWHTWYPSPAWPGTSLGSAGTPTAPWIMKAAKTRSIKDFGSVSVGDNIASIDARMKDIPFQYGLLNLLNTFVLYRGGLLSEWNFRYINYSRNGLFLGMKTYDQVLPETEQFRLKPGISYGLRNRLFTLPEAIHKQYSLKESHEANSYFIARQNAFRADNFFPLNFTSASTATDRQIIQQPLRISNNPINARFNLVSTNALTKSLPGTDGWLSVGTVLTYDAIVTQNLAQSIYQSNAPFPDSYLTKLTANNNSLWYQSVGGNQNDTQWTPTPIAQNAIYYTNTAALDFDWGGSGIGQSRSYVVPSNIADTTVGIYGQQRSIFAIGSKSIEEYALSDAGQDALNWVRLQTTYDQLISWNGFVKLNMLIKNKGEYYLNGVHRAPDIFNENQKLGYPTQIKGEEYILLFEPYGNGNNFYVLMFDSKNRYFRTSYKNFYQAINIEGQKDVYANALGEVCRCNPNSSYQFGSKEYAIHWINRNSGNHIISEINLLFNDFDEMSMSINRPLPVDDYTGTWPYASYTIVRRVEIRKSSILGSPFYYYDNNVRVRMTRNSLVKFINFGRSDNNRFAIKVNNGFLKSISIVDNEKDQKEDD